MKRLPWMQGDRLGGLPPSLMADGEGVSGRRPLVAGAAVLDVSARRVLVEGYVVHLPHLEVALLEVLMRSAGRVIDADEMPAATQGQIADARLVVKLARRLIRRLAVSPLLPPLVERVGPHGYRLTSIRTDS